MERDKLGDRQEGEEGQAEIKNLANQVVLGTLRRLVLEDGIDRIMLDYHMGLEATKLIVADSLNKDRESQRESLEKMRQVMGYLKDNVFPQIYGEGSK